MVRVKWCKESGGRKKEENKWEKEEGEKDGRDRDQRQKIERERKKDVFCRKRKRMGDEEYRNMKRKKG